MASGANYNSLMTAGMVPAIPVIGEKDMPRKYQNGKLEKRSDVVRPYWFIRITAPLIEDGKRVKRRIPQRIGFCDEIGKREAMVIRAEILERTNAPRMMAQSRMKFADVVAQYLKTKVPQLGVAVRQRYPSQIKNHILPAFGDMLMADIDRLTVEAWLLAKKSDGLAPWTLTGLKGLLSGIFTTAKEWKVWSGDNPCLGIRVKKGLKREKRKLSGPQLVAILAALQDREAFIVRILFGLGLRMSECLGLRWSDVKDGQLAIRRRWYRGDLAEFTKTETSTRQLAIGAFMSMEFESRRIPGDGLIFGVVPDGFPPDDRDLLREWFRPVIVKLGLYYEGFGWHAFRRENITMRQQVGATPIEAMNAAGHASLGMTSLYTLPDFPRQATHVDAIFASLASDGATKQ